MTQWLTIEQAATQFKLEAAALTHHLSQTNPASQFNQVGLYFDADRYRNQQSDFLRQLIPSDLPFDFDRGKIDIHLTLYPATEGDRLVCLSITTQEDFPLIAACNFAELMPLPAPLAGLIDRFQQDLPLRQLRHQVQERQKSQKQHQRPASPATAPSQPMTTVPRSSEAIASPPPAPKVQQISLI